MPYFALIKMKINILDINRENLEKIIPELISLEHNWTELGDKAWTEDNFRMELPKKWKLSFYASNESDIVGYAICSSEGEIGKLNKIIVDKKFRGNGISDIFWGEFLNRCKDNKLRSLEFKVLTDNLPAINLYKKHNCLFYGFTRGEDGLIRADVKYTIDTQRIKHSSPTISYQDKESVDEAIISGNLAGGEIVNAFENSVAKYIGTKFGVATNSGTSALHLALKALDVKEGDEVILPSYVCGSVLNAVNYCNASPVIADINDVCNGDYNISFEETRKKVNNKTKAIILPHMFGNPVKDIEKFLELNIPIIEDCAMSIGAEHNNRKIGSFGDISVFSFYATKMMTTGVGGMILTNNENLRNNLLNLMQYDNREIFGEGYNYRMSDFQAAMGLSQLKKLDSFVKKRKDIASSYNYLFRDISPEFIIPKADEKENIFFRYIIQSQNKDKNLENFISEIRNRGVDISKPVYKPIHNYLNLSDSDFPNTSNAYKSAFSIPIYPSITPRQIHDTASIILNNEEEMGRIK